LCKHGFREGYETWTEHGESHIRHDEGDSIANGEGFDEVDRMDQMLIDLARDNPPIVDEQTTPFVIAFYRMVDSASELVYEKTTHSRLSAVARLLAIKSGHNMSIAEYDDIIGIIHELLPSDSNLPSDFYQSSKLL
jgi:hypothetical protein